MADDAPTTESHEEIEALLSDYRDGALSDADRARVKAHLDGCEACRAEYAQLEETLSALSGIKGKKEGAPPELTDRVTETIHRRSAGRFFGRKTFGDRVPFGLLLIVALIVLGVTAAMLRSSNTGTLRTRTPAPAAPVQGSGHLTPTP
jgi:anti-sigma factor (TIGR02949 family)